MSIRPFVRGIERTLRGRTLQPDEVDLLRQLIDIADRSYRVVPEPLLETQRQINEAYRVRGPSPELAIVDEPFDNGSSDRIFSRQDIERAFGIEDELAPGPLMSQYMNAASRVEANSIRLSPLSPPGGYHRPDYRQMYLNTEPIEHHTAMALMDLTDYPPVRPDDPGPLRYLPPPLKFEWSFEPSEPFSFTTYWDRQVDGNQMGEPDA